MTTFPRAKTIRFNDVTNDAPGVGYYSVRSPFTQKFRGSFLRSERWDGSQVMGGHLRFPGNFTRFSASHSVMTSTPAQRGCNSQPSHIQPLRNQLMDLSCISHAPGSTANRLDVSCQPNPDSLQSSPSKRCVSCGTYEKQLNQEIFVRRQLEDQIRKMMHDNDQLEASLLQMDAALNCTDAEARLEKLAENNTRVNELVTRLADDLRRQSISHNSNAPDRLDRTFDVCVAQAQQQSSAVTALNEDSSYNAAVLAKQNKILVDALRNASGKISRIVRNSRSPELKVEPESVENGILDGYNALIANLYSQIESLNRDGQDSEHVSELECKLSSLSSKYESQSAVVSRQEKDLEVIGRQLSTLTSEFNALNLDYEREVALKQSYQQEIENLKSFIAELQKDYEAQSELPSDESDRMNDSDINRKEMKTSMSLIREQIQLTMQQMTNLNKESSVVKSMNTDLETHNYCLQQTVDILEAQISELKAELSSLRNDLNFKTSEMTSLTENLNEEQAKNVDLERTNLGYAAEIESLKHKLIVSEKLDESFSRRESDLKRDVSLARAKISALQTRLSKKKEEEDSLAFEVKQSGRLIETLKNQLSQTRQEMGVLKEEHLSKMNELKDVLTFEQSQSQGIIADLKRQKRDLNCEINKMQGELEALSSEKAELTKLVGSKDREIESAIAACRDSETVMEEVNANLRKQLDELREQRDSLSSKLASTMKRSEILTSDIERLTREVNKKDDKIKELEYSLMDLKQKHDNEVDAIRKNSAAEIEDVRGSLNCASAEAEALRSQIEKLSAQIGFKSECHASVLTKVAAQLTDLTSMIATRDEEYAKLSTDMRKQEVTHQSLVQSLQSEISTMKNQYDLSEKDHKTDLEFLESQLEESKTTISSLSNDKALLGARLDELKSSHESREKILKEQMISLEKRIQREQTDHVHAVSELRHQLEVTCNELKDLRDEKKRLIDEQESHVFRLNEQIVELENSKSSLLAEIASEKKKSDETVSMQSSMIGSLESRLQQTESSYQSRLSETQQRLAEYNSEKEKLHDEYNVLKSRFEENNERIEKLGFDLESASQERCILKSDVERLNHENDELKRTVDSLREKNCLLVQKTEFAESKLAESEYECKSLQEQLQEMTLQVSELDTSLQDLACEKDELQDCLSKTKHELAESNVIINSLKQEVKSKSAEVSELERMKEDLGKRLSDAENDYESEKYNSDTWAVKNHKTTVEIERLSSMVTSREKELDEIKDRERDSENQILKLQEIVNEQKNDLYSLQRNLESLQDSHQSLEQELQSKSHDLSFADQIQELENQLGSERLKGAQEIKRLEIENKQYLMKIIELREVVQSYEDMNSNYGDYKEEYHRLISENEELKAKLDESSKVIEKKAADVVSLEGKLSSREAQLSAALMSNSRASSLNQKLQDCEAKNNDLTCENEKLRKESEDLKEELTSIKTELNTTKSENNKNALLLNSKNTFLNKQLHEYKSRSFQLETDASELKFSLESKEKEIQALKDQISSFNEQNSSDSEELTHVRAQLDDYIAENLKLQREKTELEVNLEVKTKSLSEIKRKVSELIRGITKLELRVSEKDINDSLKENEIFDVLKELDTSRFSLQQFEETFQAQQTLLLEKEEAVRRLSLELDRRTEEIQELKELNGGSTSDEILRTMYENVVTEKAAIEELYHKLQQKVEPFREVLAQYDAEKHLLMERSYQSEAQYNELADRYAQLLGHQNNKQKIKHIQKLKCDNIRLQKENTELREDLRKASFELRNIVQKDCVRAAKACNAVRSAPSSSEKVLKENQDSNCL